MVMSILILKKIEVERHDDGFAIPSLNLLLKDFLLEFYLLMGKKGCLQDPFCTDHGQTIPSGE